MTDPRYLRPGADFALAHAIEEAGEFLAAAGKAQRWGLDSVNPEVAPAHQGTNENWLRREANDLTSAIARLFVALNARAEERRCDYLINDDRLMTATPDWQRNDEATAMRLLSCHSIDVTVSEIAAWTDEQVKQADIWAWTSALSASDHDDIKVPPRPDFIPDAPDFSRRHPITGEPL